MSGLSRVLIIGGVGNSQLMLEAIRQLNSVADVIVVEAVEEAKKAELAFVSLGESTVVAAEALARFKETYAECGYKRERDYPTLREGIRRKTIKSLRKGQR